MSTYKIIGADGQQYGPATVEQIRRWLAENRVRSDTLVQQEGATEWKPLTSFPELAPDPSTAPPPFGSTTVPPYSSPRQAEISSKASTKIGAGLCGILLGGLGIHKFILGYTGAGIIMLLITLLTCGIGGIVTSIIGLVEGIIYLTKSDEDFVRTYVDGRREWF